MLLNVLLRTPRGGEEMSIRDILIGDREDFFS
jgi:hypothetical protein